MSERYGSKIIWENDKSLGVKEIKHVRRYPTGLLEFHYGVEKPGRVELDSFSITIEQLEYILEAAQWEEKMEEQGSET